MALPPHSPQQHTPGLAGLCAGPSDGTDRHHHPDRAADVPGGFFSTTAIAIYLAGYTFHSALLHANTRLSFGPLEAVFTPPRIHHWHHADQVEAYDSNFGSQLVIWDRLFGTAYRPDADRPARFGVDAPPAEDFAAHLLAPFRAQPEPFTPPLSMAPWRCRRACQAIAEKLRNSGTGPFQPPLSPGSRSA
ncbi:sterol desaturase family protein [Novosphingobium colocasiae]